MCAYSRYPGGGFEKSEPPFLFVYPKPTTTQHRVNPRRHIPYTAQMIATITRQQIGTVERALQIFLKLGLVEVLDSGTFYMSNIELLIGQSSTQKSELDNIYSIINKYSDDSYICSTKIESINDINTRQ